MKDIMTAPFMVEMIRTVTNMYAHGWDERNGGNISLLLDEAPYERVVVDELLTVFIRLLLVHIVTDLEELNEHGQFGATLQFGNRLFEPRVCFVFDWVAGEVFAILQSFFTQYIGSRVLGVAAEEADTHVAHIKGELSQTLFFCLVRRVGIQVVHNLCAIGIDGFIGIGTFVIDSHPRFVGFVELLGFHECMHYGHVFDALGGDGGVFLLVE